MKADKELIGYIRKRYEKAKKHKEVSEDYARTFYTGEQFALNDLLEILEEK